MKEKVKLEVDQEGNLQEKKTVDINSINELIEVNFEPKNNWIVLQPLPEKEVKTNSGIYVPGSKTETKCAVIAADSKSEYKRGQVILIDPSMFGSQVQGHVDYIEGKPTLMVPEHFIKGIYTKYDLSNWK
jgi:co-chaperonin GroES (HSP10)